MELKYIVRESDNYKNINEILNKEFEFSTRLIAKLIKNNKISLNGKMCNTRWPIKRDDVITIDLSIDEDNSNIVPTKMDLDIIYEDEWLLVVNKPAGIAIHPSQLHYDNSLSNGIKYYFDLIELKKKIRPVNRLDFNTSGLVIFAKCEYIQEAFSKQMQNNIFKKEYLCIAEKPFEDKNGTINLPIARKEGSIIERCIDYDKGQKSVTHYEVIDEFENYSLVKCKLETGRTHQIRVHLSNIGHPLLGDTLYGNSSNLITRQALHSFRIILIHPISKKQLCFKSNLPNDMQKLIY
ncbi:MAG: RluA family pseudouridine synthase [Clostridia bacterium]|nr:RluA family pseudouridine synthase [Clostridia bacterium]